MSSSGNSNRFAAVAAAKLFTVGVGPGCAALA